jgi:hypothetical protein
MRLTIQKIGFVGISILLIIAIGSGHASAAIIDGRISLVTPKGEVFHGDWIRVFLTTKPIEVPTVELASIDIPLERRSRINTGHMDFYVNFQQKQQEPGYIADTKLTRPDGTFAFHRVSPGRYYVLITFPTMIAGFKCAWQVGVEVNEGQTVRVELDNSNLALPAY